jgi:outer membrane protein
MKKSLILSILILAPLIAFGSDTKIIKIGHIDVQRVLKSYSKGKKVVDFLKNLESSYEDQKKEMEKEIRRLEKELEMKSKDLNEKQIREYLTQIEEKRKELEIFIRNANQDMEKKQQEMLAPLYNKIIEVTKREAPKKGFNFIIDSKYVLMTDPELDITEMIIKVLEAEN